MQKKLIVAALAGLAAAPAFAQSNVTVYGVFDVGYTSQEAKNTFVAGSTTAVTSVAAGATVKTKNTGLDGTLSGGRLGFKGTEDLGNGLKANFVLEFGTNWSENTGIGATRLGWAGVSGNFGEVRVGRIQSPIKNVLDAYNPNENSTNFVPGNLDAHLGLTDVRVSNAITYMTPAISGLSAKVQYANVESDTDATVSKAQDKYMNFGVDYAFGQLNVAYARNQQTTNSELAAGDAKAVAQVLAVKYNLGMAVPFYSHTERDIENAAGAKTVDSSVDTIGVTVPVGNLKLVAQYATGKSKAGTLNNVAFGNKIDHKAYQLLGVYSLSKRTNVYGIYGSTESKDKDAAAGTKFEQDGFALGLRHSF